MVNGLSRSPGLATHAEEVAQESELIDPTRLSGKSCWTLQASGELVVCADDEFDWIVEFLKTDLDPVAFRTAAGLIGLTIRPDIHIPTLAAMVRWRSHFLAIERDGLSIPQGATIAYSLSPHRPRRVQRLGT
jgi:hypothetical protein